MKNSLIVIEFFDIQSIQDIINMLKMDRMSEMFIYY